jgi:hypothetical protein
VSEPVCLDAGRELDAMVAERAMGWERRSLQDTLLNPRWFNDQSLPMYVVEGLVDYLVPHGHPDAAVGVLEVTPSGLRIGGGRVPRYSVDTPAAWDVLENMRARGWTVELRGFRIIEGKETNDWVCSIESRPQRVTERAATAPLAICLAAIAALHAQQDPTATPDQHPLKP